ncbi:MAG TPA: glutathione S-transferase family protein [Spongiibacteraceae bacterium]|nr:glutathione S-transferase family protein [Spongiibacteraceae bacterium]
MLKLYGYVISNYYNMVEHALLTKGVAFDREKVLPGGDAAYLDKSPLGKIPSIETEHGFLSETSVILDYIEAHYPQPPLAPADRWGQFKMKELMKITELYIELQARRLLPALMGGIQLDQATLDDVATIMGKGYGALARLGQFTPYLMGEQVTMADIVLRYSLVVPKLCASLVKIDAHAIVPGLAAWETRMDGLEVSRSIDARMKEEMPKFMAQRAQQGGA